MKEIIKKIISYLFFKYCFSESNIANLFISYYVPGIINKGHAGQYLFGKINEKTNKIEPIYDAIKLADPKRGIILLDRYDKYDIL